MTGTLFSDDVPSGSIRTEGVRRFAEKHIYFGTSSWKYPGWKSLVYTKKYASDKAFERECLEEYAHAYPIVGVDHTYYAWPLPKTFAGYMDQTPDSFRFLCKATERVTVFRFPNLPRYGKDAGKQNPDFLNADLFCEQFVKPLMEFREKLGPVMFEFSQFYSGMLSNGSEFVDKLRDFLKILRAHTCFEYAVEMRNKNWLEKPYFEALAENGAGHVFNSWTRMPSLTEQMARSQPVSLPFFIARLLLEPGVKYEQAVEAYSPYDRIHQPLPTLRASAAALASMAKKENKRAYILVNNRAEGCAPLTINSIIEILEKTEKTSP